MSNPLLARTATELGPLLRARQVSPVDLVQACLTQIEAVNPVVNAFLTITGERALDQARQAEREIAAGRYKGPLHGIPYAPKDILATKGIRTTNGSRVTENWMPDFESTVTERLAQAGAILVGKLNLLEFAMGSGQRGLKGPARNPWHLDYSPSGSSSGSGAALAARMVPLVIGTDTGGSIRGPAKSCGVVGLKPTYGRVSRYGVTTLSWTLDHVGPLGRSVADVAMMLREMAGADPRDATAAKRPVPDYTRTEGVRGLRIGVPRGYLFERVHPETNAALEGALAVLRRLGATLVDITIENAALCGPALSVILGAESASYHQRRLRESPELLDPLVRERLEANSLYSALDYIQALRFRTVMMEQMRRVFTRCDVLFLPAGNAAPLLQTEIVGTDLPPAAPPPPRPDSWNLANLTGIPSLVLPCGFTTTPPLLPLGMQLCAKPFAEATLFRLGMAYQAATDWHQRTPPQLL
jgi:aspartyl-tRNA(Asn)/glutamyl-tRNA(Gln) amidotransferase subunit A